MNVLITFSFLLVVVGATFVGAQPDASGALDIGDDYDDDTSSLDYESDFDIVPGSNRYGYLRRYRVYDQPNRIWRGRFQSVEDAEEGSDSIRYRRYRYADSDSRQEKRLLVRKYQKAFIPMKEYSVRRRYRPEPKLVKRVVVRKYKAPPAPKRKVVVVEKTKVVPVPVPQERKERVVVVEKTKEVPVPVENEREEVVYDPGLAYEYPAYYYEPYGYGYAPRRRHFHNKYYSDSYSPDDKSNSYEEGGKRGVISDTGIISSELLNY